MYVSVTNRTQVQPIRNYTRFEQVRCTIASKINITLKGVRLSKKKKNTVIKFDCSNKFDLYYYWQHGK